MCRTSRASNVTGLVSVVVHSAVMTSRPLLGVDIKWSGLGPFSGVTPSNVGYVGVICGPEARRSSGRSVRDHEDPLPFLLPKFSSLPLCAIHRDITPSLCNALVIWQRLQRLQRLQRGGSWSRAY